MTHSPGFLALVNDAKSRIRQVNIDQYREMVSLGDQHLLIDVRADGEWAAGHAAGAVPLGKGIIERDIESEVPAKHATLGLSSGGVFRRALCGGAMMREC